MLLKTPLWNSLMMNSSKSKVAYQKSTLSDYEIQQIQRLKRNADIMEAKGYESLANKIYKERDPTHFANVATGLSSDSDEEYMVEKGDENETQISNRIEISNSGSKNNMKVIHAIVFIINITNRAKKQQTGLIYPQEFVQTVQRDLIGKLQEANAGVDLVLPECIGGLISSDASKVKSVGGNSSGGQSSVSAGNQVQNELNGSNDEALTHGEELEG